jgi:hypothetical protein
MRPNHFRAHGSDGLVKSRWRVLARELLRPFVGFFQPFVGFFVGFFELPDINLSFGMNGLSPICRVCRVYMTGESPREFRGDILGGETDRRLRN